MHDVLHRRRCLRERQKAADGDTVSIFSTSRYTKPLMLGVLDGGRTSSSTTLFRMSYERVGE